MKFIPALNVNTYHNLSGIYVDTGNKRYNPNTEQEMYNISDLIEDIIQCEKIIDYISVYNGLKIVVPYNDLMPALEKISLHKDTLENELEKTFSYTLYRFTDDIIPNMNNETFIENEILHMVDNDEKNINVLAFPETVPNTIKMSLVLKYSLVPYIGFDNFYITN